jgi:hypothetical protein
MGPSGPNSLRNFELGVLFHSNPDLQYRTLPSIPRAPTENDATPRAPAGNDDAMTVAVAGDALQAPRVVCLPLPYSLVGLTSFVRERYGSFHSWRQAPYVHELEKIKSQGNLEKCVPKIEEAFRLSREAWAAHKRGRAQMEAE